MSPSPRRSWREHMRLPLLVLLALNAAVFAAYTLPRLAQERGLERRAAALRADLERQRAETERLRVRAERVTANTRDAQRLLTETLPSRGEGLLVLLRDIEAAARDSGLTLRTRSYGQEDVEDLPLVRVAISVPVQGSYRQLVAFVERLERSRRFLVVDRVQLRGRGGASPAELSVELSAYFRAEPGASDAD